MFCQKTERFVSRLVVENWMVDVCQRIEHIVSRLVVDNWRVDVCQKTEHIFRQMEGGCLSKD